MIDQSRRGRTGRANGGPSPLAATALRGAIGAVLLASGGAARAANECGLPEDGVVVCTPEGNPYPAGITYETPEDLTLTVTAGVVAQRTVRANGLGTASIVIDIAEGASINTAGIFAEGVAGLVQDGGSLTINSAGSIVTDGFLAAGIRALARGGPITIRAADIDSTGGAGISVGGSEGLVFIESTGHIRAEEGDGLFGGGSNAVAGMFINTDGPVEVINTGFVEQLGQAEFDPDGTYITNGGIEILTSLDGDVFIGGEGSIETSGFGATGISVRRAGTVSIRQSSVVTHGDQASAIGAAAVGDVAIDADTVVSDRSVGILGFSIDGDVAIRFGSLGAVGLGAYGESSNGSVSIAAGDVTISASPVGLVGSAIQILTGLNADVTLSGSVRTEQGFGISADSGGDASVLLEATAAIDADVGGVRLVSGGHATVDNRGTISAGAYGIRVDSASAEIGNSGSIVGRGDGQGGILVQTTGDLRITGNGSVTASGENSHGIQAAGATVAIVQGRVAAEGSNAPAISARGVGDVEVDVGEVSSAQGIGVSAESSSGSVAIAVDALEATGAGIQARAPGTVTLSVGSASVPGFEAQAITAESGGEAIVSVAGEVLAPEGFGVSIFSQSDAGLEVASSGSIEAGIIGAFIRVGPDGAATVDNAGAIIGGTGHALFVEGGSAEIVNSGILAGSVGLTGGDDTLENDGAFHISGQSDFGAGDDRLINAGDVFAGAGGASTVEVIGLERFTNGGFVSLADGEANDELVLDGDYAGEDGVLLLDVVAGEADLLVVEGAATGRTFVEVDGPAGRLDTGTLIVRAGAGSSADAFTTEGRNIGFVEYGIRYDAGTGYSLVGAPGDAAVRTVRYLEGVRNLWQDSSDAWTAHMRGRRDAEAPGRGFWIQARGSVASRRGGRSDTVFGITTATDAGYRQDHFGAQLGYDFGRGAGGLGFGLTAGYGSSDLGFRQSRSSLDYSVINAGAYVAFASGPFFANLLGKYDHVSGEARDPGIGLAVDSDGGAFGATAEIGARIGSERLFIEPVAALSWVRADLDAFSALSSEVDFRTTDGLLGKLGARFGSAWETGGTAFSLYAGGNAVKALGERDAVLFSNNGQTVRIENDRAGLYGEATVGLSVASRAGVTGYFEGFGTFGGSDDLRGAGGRAGIRVAF